MLELLIIAGLIGFGYLCAATWHSIRSWWRGEDENSN